MDEGKDWDNHLVGVVFRVITESAASGDQFDAFAKPFAARYIQQDRRAVVAYHTLLGRDLVQPVELVSD